MNIEVNKPESYIEGAKSSIDTKNEQYIDLTEANKTTKQQSQWIKKHTFKIAFE